MRTPEEVKKQIEGLTKMKEWLPSHSMFGTPNHDCIDAQIELLEGKKDIDDFEEADDPEEDDEQHLYNAALEAEQWMNGEREEDLFETQGEK